MHICLRQPVELLPELTPAKPPPQPPMAHWKVA